MMRRAHRLYGCALALALAPAARATGGSATSEPPSDGVELSSAITECVAAHESAGMSRLDEHWIAARDAAARCAVPSCPLAIRSDCRAWFDEIGALLPTLLVVVERDDDASGPLALELDGQRFVLDDPPEPVETTPGVHHLRVLLAGHAPFELDVRVERGEKNHLVRARFVTPPTPPAAARTKPEDTASPAAHVTSARPVPFATYAYAGGAVVAFGASGALLGSALASRATARDECAPACASSVRRSIDTRLLVADVAGAAGLVLGGLAVYSYVTRPTLSQRPASLRFTLATARDHAGLVVEGGF